jgi:hypothetical protein
LSTGWFTVPKGSRRFIRQRRNQCYETYKIGGAPSKQAINSSVGRFFARAALRRRPNVPSPDLDGFQQLPTLK